MQKEKLCQIHMIGRFWEIERLDPATVDNWSAHLLQWHLNSDPVVSGHAAILRDQRQRVGMLHIMHFSALLLQRLFRIGELRVNGRRVGWVVWAAVRHVYPHNVLDVWRYRTEARGRPRSRLRGGRSSLIVWSAYTRPAHKWADNSAVTTLWRQLALHYKCVNLMEPDPSDTILWVSKEFSGACERLLENTDRSAVDVTEVSANERLDPPNSEEHSSAHWSFFPPINNHMYCKT